MSEVKVTKENFKAEVLESEQTVIVDFWATWCGPCQMLAPELDAFAEENPSIKVCKVNVDEEAELSIEYGVVSIPMLLVFKNGDIANKSVGYCTKDEIAQLI